MSSTQPKTVPVAVWTDGRTATIVRTAAHGIRGWAFDSNGSVYSHLDMAIAAVERDGGRVERRPNPRYSRTRSYAGIAIRF